MGKVVGFRPTEATLARLDALADKLGLDRGGVLSLAVARLHDAEFGGGVVAPASSRPAFSGGGVQDYQDDLEDYQDDLDDLDAGNRADRRAVAALERRLESAAKPGAVASPTKPKRKRRR